MLKPQCKTNTFKIKQSGETWSMRLAKSGLFFHLYCQATMLYGATPRTPVIKNP